MKSTFDLFCLGGSSVDIILKVPNLPGSDQKLVAEYVGHSAGGLVANTAAAEARLGLKVAWDGRVGEDENGCAVYPASRPPPGITQPQRG